MFKSVSMEQAVYSISQDGQLDDEAYPFNTENGCLGG
jgi:hypothetical protein